jgi:hypothetical protein
MTRRVVTIAFALVAAVALVGTAQAGSTFQIGDVFVAIGGGQVEEFTPTGTPVQILDDTTGSITTGMAFDSSGNLYVTNFSVGSVSQFNVNGSLMNKNFITGQTNPESISFAYSTGTGGHFPMLVGDAGRNTISQYGSSGGSSPTTWTVNIQNRGTDWVDLQTDNHTVYYTSEGSSILSYDISGSGHQNANFFDGLPGGAAFALRTVLSGAFAGDVLVADSSAALLVNSSGIVKTYTLPGNGGGDFSLNLDPTGTAFWTGDFATGEVWEVNIATGNILEQWNSGSGSMYGITVFGESGQGGSTPEPASLLLLGTGIVGIATKLKFRKRG